MFCDMILQLTCGSLLWYKLHQETLTAACDYLEAKKDIAKHFGNGRVIRNLFIQMKKNLAKRIIGFSKDRSPFGLNKATISTFTLQDVPIVDRKIYIEEQQNEIESFSTEWLPLSEPEKDIKKAISYLSNNK